MVVAAVASHSGRFPQLGASGGVTADGGDYTNPSRTASIVTTRSSGQKIRIYIPIAC